MAKKIKFKKQFAGWYDVFINNEIAYTIVQNDYNKTWNIFEKDNVATGHIDAVDTLREAKSEIERWVENM